MHLGRPRVVRTLVVVKLPIVTQHEPSLVPRLQPVELPLDNVHLEGVRGRCCAGPSRSCRTPPLKHPSDPIAAPASQLITSRRTALHVQCVLVNPTHPLPPEHGGSCSHDRVPPPPVVVCPTASKRTEPCPVQPDRIPLQPHRNPLPTASHHTPAASDLSPDRFGSRSNRFGSQSNCIGSHSNCI